MRNRISLIQQTENVQSVVSRKIYIFLIALNQFKISNPAAGHVRENINHWDRFGSVR